MAKLVMPDFQTEREEADWWFQNQDVIAAEFLEQQGQEFLDLIINKEDARLGKEKAAASGMTYKAYMVRLIHLALRDAKSA